MRAISSRLLAAVVVLVGLPAGALAATTRVTGGDAAALQTALDTAQPGDVIVVKKGTYSGNFAIRNRMDVTIRGSGKPLLDAGGIGDTLSITGCSGVTVSGCRVEGAGGDGVHVVDSSDVLLRSLRVSGAAGDGIEIGSGSVRVTVDRCKVKDSGEYGIQATAAGVQPVDCVIRGGKVSGAGFSAIRLWGSRHRVEKVRVVGGSTAIDIASSDSAVVRCSVSGSNHGIQLIIGDRVTVSKCKIRDVTGHGVGVLSGTGHRIEQVRTKRTGGHGIYAASSGLEIVRCNVVKAGGTGYHIASTESLVDACKAKKSTRHGVFVSGTSNTIRRCKIRKSGENDLTDATLGDSNTYETNKAQPVVHLDAT